MKRLPIALLLLHICGNAAFAQNFYCPPPPPIFYCPPQIQQVRRIPQVSESRTYQPTQAPVARNGNTDSTVVTPRVTTPVKPAAPRFDADDAKPSAFVPMTDEGKEEILREIRSLREDLKSVKDRLDKLEEKRKEKDDSQVKVHHKSTW